jgi:NTE family protein
MNRFLPGRTTALVLSGGGTRAAYQAGALKAVIPHLKEKELTLNIIVGSSIGAVNGLVVGAALNSSLDDAAKTLEDLWGERNFSNTFRGHPTASFFRAITVAISQWMSPGPKPTNRALFDPAPLRDRLDGVIRDYGGLHPLRRSSALESIAVMTTLEGDDRKPLLLLSRGQAPSEESLTGATFSILRIDELSASHGLASAALPSILPPVEIELETQKFNLVDGGICQNVPVDPATRLGGDNVIVVDVSGRDWWLDRSGKPHYSRPSWEVLAETETFCPTPLALFSSRCQEPLGPVLKHAVGSSTKAFMRAVGPVWPLYSLLRNKMGEDIAYEVMTYVALDPDYLQGIIEQGFKETQALLLSDSN